MRILVVDDNTESPRVRVRLAAWAVSPVECVHV